MEYENLLHIWTFEVAYTNPKYLSQTLGPVQGTKRKAKSESIEF